jgi:hypothetical protein
MAVNENYVKHKNDIEEAHSANASSSPSLPSSSQAVKLPHLRPWYPGTRFYHIPLMAYFLIGLQAAQL